MKKEKQNRLKKRTVFRFISKSKLDSQARSTDPTTSLITTATVTEI